MEQHSQNEYDVLIKKIKSKRKFVIVVTIVVLLITLLFASPIQVQVLEKTIVNYKGINPIITVILILFIFLIECVTYALVSSPLTTSMSVECNPQKHLILNVSLKKQKNIDHIYATDLMYMGNFKGALDYANRMISSKKASLKNIGLFNKARCQFFISDFDSLKVTIKQYEVALANIKKINNKTKAIYDKIQNTMKLLLAIADNDKEKIIQYYKVIEVWNNSKATEGYINYLKGVAAFHMEDKEEAIYRLMAVKDNCGKTVFSTLADEYLVQLK